MLRIRHLAVPHLLLALVAAGGCGDPETTPTAPLEAVQAEPPRLPPLPPVTFASVEHETITPSAPARAESEIGGDDLESRPLQQIFNPRTIVGIADGYGYVFAIGRHSYIGNMGAVSATAHAAFQDQHLGSYTAERQNYTPFLVDFGTVKDIWASAKVYTDKTCGLTALGDSKHSAWWQFYQGRAAPVWGVSRSYSQGQPAHQRSCSSTTTTTSGGAGGSTGGITCYVLITWDLGTGKVVNTQILACSGAGDERW